MKKMLLINLALLSQGLINCYEVENDQIIENKIKVEDIENKTNIITSPKDAVFSVATLNKLVPIVQNTRSLVSTSIDLENWFKENVIEGPKSVRIVGENGKNVISGPNNENIADLIRSLAALSSNLLTHLLGTYDAANNKIVTGDNDGVLLVTTEILSKIMELINGLQLPVNKASAKIQAGSAKAEEMLVKLKSTLGILIKNVTEVLSITDLVVSIISPAKTSTTTPIVIELNAQDFQDAGQVDGMESVTADELENMLADLE